MHSNDKLCIKGSGTFILRKESGDVEVTYRDNIIVDVGFDFVCDALAKASGRPAVMSHIAIGSDNTAAAAGNTALGTEITRVAATYAHTAGTKTFTLAGTFDVGVGTGAIVEAGILNAASSGILIDRVVFPVINKGAGDALDALFTFNLT